MKRIKEIIFMGQGDYSLEQCKKVKAILKKAFSDLSGFQQLSFPHSSSLDEAKEAEKERINVEKDIEDAVADIAMALTGKEIAFKKNQQ